MEAVGGRAAHPGACQQSFALIDSRIAVEDRQARIHPARSTSGEASPPAHDAPRRPGALSWAGETYSRCEGLRVQRVHERRPLLVDAGSNCRGWRRRRADLGRRIGLQGCLFLFDFRNGDTVHHCCTPGVGGRPPELCAGACESGRYWRFIAGGERFPAGPTYSSHQTRVSYPCAGADWAFVAAFPG